jgi:hypothetical protein
MVAEQGAESFVAVCWWHLLRSADRYQHSVPVEAAEQQLQGSPRQRRAEWQAGGQ